MKPRIPSVDEILREIRVEPSRTARRLASRYGYLDYMVQRYIDMLGINEAEKLLEAFEKPLKPVVRCNDLLIDCNKLVRRLERLGFKLRRIDWSIHGYRVVEEPGSPTIGATHEYLKGYYYVHRDAASLIPGILLIGDHYTGMVLDMCAAPGGKTTHIAQLLRGGGKIIANDLVLYRLKALIGHIARMRFDNIHVLWSDARKLPALLDEKYERILLDVPCSGEGTIMFDPGRKTRTTQKDLARIVRREIELLHSGIKLLSPDGILTYVTCSIAPEENEYVLTKVLEERSDIEIIEPPIRLFEWDKWYTGIGRHDYHPDLEKCIRVWPHKHGMIGFTTCLLRRTS